VPPAPGDAAAMPSIPIKIRMLPARRARSAVPAPDPDRGSVGAPGGRDPASRSILEMPIRRSRRGWRLTTLPPSATPKDEFDLGIGYIERKIMRCGRDHAQLRAKIPRRSLTADSQYWLGESFFQRQRYRDAANPFSR